MELRVLQYFLVVAREENITKAAALLHITQPTLSRQLMQMEKERLENGILDMGLLLEPVEISRYHYARMPLMEQYYALMRSDCPLAALPAVTPQDLVNMPLIVAKRQSVRNQLEHWFGQDAKNLRIACTCNLSHNNLSVMVQSGVGVTVTIKAADIYQDLCFRPLQPQLANGCVLVWKKNQTLSAALEKFIAHQIWIYNIDVPLKRASIFFLCTTGVQMKYVIKQINRFADGRPPLQKYCPHYHKKGAHHQNDNEGSPRAVQNSHENPKRV